MNTDQNLDLFILELLRIKGFSKVNQHSFQLLSHYVKESLYKKVGLIKSLVESNQRMDMSVLDVIQTLEDYEIDEIRNYAKSTKD